MQGAPAHALLMLFSPEKLCRAQQGQQFNFSALGSQHQQTSPTPQRWETRALSAQQLKSPFLLSSSAFSIFSPHWVNNKVCTCQSVFKLNWTGSTLPKPSVPSFYFTQQHNRTPAQLCSSEIPFKASSCRWKNLNFRYLQAQPTVADN